MIDAGIQCVMAATGDGCPADPDGGTGEKSCPLSFGLKNGAPLIGLGALLIFAVAVPLLVPGSIPPVPFPVSLVFVGFGVFLVWLGLFR